MTRAIDEGRCSRPVLLANLPAWAQQRIYTGNTMGRRFGQVARPTKWTWKVVIQTVTAVNGRIKQQGPARTVTSMRR